MRRRRLLRTSTEHLLTCSHSCRAHPTTIQELVTEAPNISEEAVQLMKFHGSYMQVCWRGYSRQQRQQQRRPRQQWRCRGPNSRTTCILALAPSLASQPHTDCLHPLVLQDNREQRTFGSGKSYQFMMRTRQPGGTVTNQLYLVMDELADLVRSCGRSLSFC